MFSHEYRHFGTCKKFTSFHMGTGTTGLVIFSDVFGGKVGKCRGKKAGFWTHGYRHFGTFSDIFRYSHMRVIATHAVYPRFIKTPALREKSAVYPRRISRKCRLFYLGTTGTFPIMVSPMYKDEVHPTGTGRLQTLERNDPARDKFFTGNLPSQSPRPRYRHFRTW